MQKIRGSTQIRPGTVPFSVVDSNFATTLMGKKAIADFVQLNNVSATAGNSFVAIQPTDLGGTTFGDSPITTTGNVGNAAPNAADLGFIATTEGGAKLGKSRSVIRDGVTQEPLFDGEYEIYGYLTIDTVNEEIYVDLYFFDGVTETQAQIPAGVTIVDLQLMRRFTLDTVGEDFGANEKWALGMIDATTALNLTQVAKDLYGAGYTLDADGLANLSIAVNVKLGNAADAVGLDANGDLVPFTGTNFLDTANTVVEGLDNLDVALQAHISDALDAHDATAISFVSGTTGLAADNVQTAIEGLKTLSDANVAAISQANQDLVDHIAATYTDADAHSAGQIEVAGYVASGIHALSAGDSLQTNLEDMVDRTYGAYTLIETHFVEPNAHMAESIDIVTSGTALDAHYPTLVGSGTVTLQDFIVYQEQHLHDVVDALDATVTASISATNAALATLDNRMEDLLGVVDGATDLDLSATNYMSAETDVTGALVAFDAAVFSAFGTLNGSVASEIARIEELLGVTAGATDMALAGTYIGATTTVDAALEALDAAVVADVAALAAHLADAVDAHDASAISFVSGTTGINADNVQVAFENVANRLNRLETEVVEQEEITVTSAGSGQTFTLAYDIKPGTKVLVIWNTTITKEYTFTGDELTINESLEIGDEVTVWYKRVVADIT